MNIGLSWTYGEQLTDTFGFEIRFDETVVH